VQVRVSGWLTALWVAVAGRSSLNHDGRVLRTARRWVVGLFAGLGVAALVGACFPTTGTTDEATPANEVPLCQFRAPGAITRAVSNCADCINYYYVEPSSCVPYWNCACSCSASDDSCLHNCESLIDKTCTAWWRWVLYFSVHDCEKWGEECTASCAGVSLPVSETDIVTLENKFGGASQFPAPECDGGGP
jgi:hypothetical protein